MKKKFILRRLCAVLFLILVLIIGGVIFEINYKNIKQEKSEKMVLDFKGRVADLANFRYENYVRIGWLQVQGTNIDYPILNSAASKIKTSELNYGWRSPNYSPGENRMVLLGHNIINVSSTPIRDMSLLNNFEGLMAFVYDDFASENLYINFTKNGEENLYKIYAIGFYDYSYDNGQSFNEEKEIKKYIEMVKKNSIYDYDIDVDSSDELITIKTCTRYFGSLEKQQFVIDARKVRKNEEILKYKATKNDNYNILTFGLEKENG